MGSCAACGRLAQRPLERVGLARCCLPASSRQSGAASGQLELRPTPRGCSANVRPRRQRVGGDVCLGLCPRRKALVACVALEARRRLALSACRSPSLLHPVGPSGPFNHLNNASSSTSASTTEIKTTLFPPPLPASSRKIDFLARSLGPSRAHRSMMERPRVRSSMEEFTLHSRQEADEVLSSGDPESCVTTPVHRANGSNGGMQVRRQARRWAPERAPGHAHCARASAAASCRTPAAGAPGSAATQHAPTCCCGPFQGASVLTIRTSEGQVRAQRRQGPLQQPARLWRPGTWRGRMRMARAPAAPVRSSLQAPAWRAQLACRCAGRRSAAGAALGVAVQRSRPAWPLPWPLP
jgi:hypothetical protein